MQHYITAGLGTDPIVDEHSFIESNGDFVATTLFSDEEESLYARRYEEKYDLCDPKYEAWLAVNQPEAVRQTLNKNLIDNQHLEEFNSAESSWSWRWEYKNIWRQ